MNRMRTEDFHYHLPEELIAQDPVPRGESRLLVCNKQTRTIEDNSFQDFPDYLQPGDVLILNDSRVIARRLFAHTENGKEAETLLLRPRGDSEWEALVRPGRRLRPGHTVYFTLRNNSVAEAKVTEITPEGGRVLRFDNSDIRDSLKEEGFVPLPPYIHNVLDDEERYQTVYSGPPGSAAAPTAGLHFSETMLAEIKNRGINIGKITLHVGIDTFRPVKEAEVEMHQMHGEWFTIPEETADMINNAKGRVVAIGTTCVRALESAAIDQGIIQPATMNTHLFILPGYRFKIVQAMLTNFHLPESTLLMLISAFAGREWILQAYEHAVKERYRFFSFGDAMLIL